VLGKFLARLRAGSIRFDNPAKLRGYLRDLADYKIRDLFADRPREQPFPDGPQRPYDPAAGSSCDPVRIVERADTLALVRRRLADDERYLFDQYRQGRPWTELAAELGKSPDALRKQLAYAIDKASRALGLRDDADE
jgi:DNA-directed RNA polymerase specialized sigma24 family protein